MSLLEKRLREMDVMSEWKTFGALAVEYLGMPEEAVPFYDNGSRFKVQGSKVMAFVMETGNFGNNRAYGYAANRSKLYNKIVSFWWRSKDSFRHFFMFPRTAVRAWWRILVTGLCEH